MSLYADYVVEREGRSVLERDDGFVVYGYLQWGSTKAVYIKEIFVKKGAREKGVAAEMADVIADQARLRDTWVMIGSVDPLAAGATTSMRVLLAYGFEVDSMDAQLIYFKKNLE